MRSDWINSRRVATRCDRHWRTPWSPCWRHECRNGTGGCDGDTDNNGLTDGELEGKWQENDDSEGKFAGHAGSLLSRPGLDDTSNLNNTLEGSFGAEGVSDVVEDWDGNLECSWAGDVGFEGRRQGEDGSDCSRAGDDESQVCWQGDTDWGAGVCWWQDSVPETSSW